MSYKGWLFQRDAAAPDTATNESYFEAAGIIYS
jgi:hypothetical protein